MKNKKDQCLTAQILIGLTMLGSVWGLPANRAEAADSASNQSRVISTAESLDAGYISAG